MTQEVPGPVVTLASTSPRFRQDDVAAMGPPVIRALGLGKQVDERALLRGIDLEIPRGCLVALLGANGAGKSTLLRVLATLSAPSQGRLELFGLGASAGRPEVRARIGLIGHQLMLYRDLSALENLEFFARLHRVEAPRERAKSLLDDAGLSDRASEPVGSLSRGMAQRVAICRALVHRPELLLADEPFTGLDAASSQWLRTLLTGLRDQGATILVAHHDIAEAVSMADQVLVLRGGELVVDSPTRGVSTADLTAAMEGQA